MGATVGCEPSCSNDELLVLPKAAAQERMSKATQAPSRTGSPRQDSDSQIDGELEEQEARRVEREVLGSSSSLLPTAAQQALQAQQAFQASAPHRSSGSQCSPESTLEDAARSAVASAGHFGSRDEGTSPMVCCKQLAGSPHDSLAHLGSPLGTLELSKERALELLDGRPQEEASSMVMGGEADRKDSSNPSFHTIEKEPSDLSGGTILPEDADPAACGKQCMQQPPPEAAFSFRTPSVDQTARGKAPPAGSGLSYSASLNNASSISPMGSSPFGTDPSGPWGTDPAAAAASISGASAGGSFGTDPSNPWGTDPEAARAAAILGLATPSAPSGAGSRGLDSRKAATPPGDHWGAAGQNPQEGPLQMGGARTASAARREAAESRLVQLANRGDPGALVEAKMKLKEWQFQLKMETKSIEREIKRVKQDEAKLQKQMQVEGQKGNVEYVKQLARTIIRSRKTVRRLEQTKVNMNDINLQLTTCAAAMSMKHAVRMTGDMMQGMNGVSSMEDLAAAVEQLQQERQRGVDMEEVMDQGFGDEDMESEVDREVQRLLEEYELDRLGLLAGSGPDPARGGALPGTGRQASRPGSTVG